jgi:acyl dehydratase
MNTNRDISVGEALPSRDFTITRADLVAYADASGDQNPIHQDEAFALSVGLPGVIAHGMFTMGLLARAVHDWAGPGSILEIGVRFTRPVVVGPEGAVVTIAGTVSAVDDGTATLDLSATAQGQTVVSRARATVRRA